MHLRPESGSLAEHHPQVSALPRKEMCLKKQVYRKESLKYRAGHLTEDQLPEECGDRPSPGKPSPRTQEQRRQQERRRISALFQGMSFASFLSEKDHSGRAEQFAFPETGFEPAADTAGIADNCCYTQVPLLWLRSCHRTGHHPEAVFQT